MPSVEIAAELPAVGIDQVAVGEVSYSYPAIPEPFGSVALPVTVPGEVVRQLALPPLTVGTFGGVLSIRTVLLASATAGAQAAKWPRVSCARNWTRVSPSAVTKTAAPSVGPDQVLPRSWTCGTGSR